MSPLEELAEYCEDGEVSLSYDDSLGVFKLTAIHETPAFKHGNTKAWSKNEAVAYPSGFILDHLAGDILYDFQKKEAANAT